MIVAATIVLSLALAFSSSFYLVGGFIFLSQCWLNNNFVVDIGGEGDVEMRQKDAHVEVIKVNEAFFDILVVVALAAFLKKKVDLLVNC